MLRFRGAPIRLVTVDFTGTVMQFKDSIGQIYCNAAEELGITHKGPDAMNTGTNPQIDYLSIQIIAST